MNINIFSFKSVREFSAQTFCSRSLLYNEAFLLFFFGDNRMINVLLLLPEILSSSNSDFYDKVLSCPIAILFIH